MGGRYRSSSGKLPSLIAFIESIMSVASSGPKMASMIDGSRVVEGTVGESVCSVVEAEEFEAAHSKSPFVRLSMVEQTDGSPGKQEF